MKNSKPLKNQNLAAQAEWDTPVIIKGWTPKFQPVNFIKRRFLKRIVKKTTSGCWIFDSVKFKKGYGNFLLNRKQQIAHRVSWIIFRGAIPPKMSVCHRCDNPPCVNPNHLFIGTVKDNNRDCVKKGRWKNNGLIGENHPFSIFKPRDIRKIRALLERISNYKIARMYKCSPSTIRQIGERETWKHVK